MLFYIRLTIDLSAITSSTLSLSIFSAVAIAQNEASENRRENTIRAKNEGKKNMLRFPYTEKSSGFLEVSEARREKSPKGKRGKSLLRKISTKAKRPGRNESRRASTRQLTAASFSYIFNS